MFDDEHSDRDSVRWQTPGYDPRSASMTSPHEWRLGARRALLDLAVHLPVISADDLRDEYPDPPGKSGAAWGAVFQHASKQGHIVMVGMGTTRRPVAHARPLRQWRVTERGRAAWEALNRGHVHP